MAPLSLVSVTVKGIFQVTELSLSILWEDKWGGLSLGWKIRGSIQGAHALPSKKNNFQNLEMSQELKLIPAATATSEHV